MDVPALLQQHQEVAISERPTVRVALVAALNRMVVHDFTGLVQLLYRVDVPEEKLRTLLLQQPTRDAGEILADLLLEREADKARQRGTTPAAGESDDERW